MAFVLRLKLLINNYLTAFITVLLIWSILWSTVGEEALPPNGSLFSLLLLFVVSYICGQLVSVLRLPPLLGMLMTGFAFGNAYDLNLNLKLSSILRSISLVVILLRAGLGLDPKVIRRLSGVCLRLSLIPCTFEAITLCVSTYLLIGFPIKWGFLLGFVLSGVSSAVVVPDMIVLQEKQLGTNKGIPTLLMASASVDNVMAITGFGVCLGLVFDSSSSLIWNIFKGPVEALTGILIGSVFGLILWYIPNKNDSNTEENEPNFTRFTLLLLFGMFAVLVSTSLDFGGAGPLGCLVLSFTASLKWRNRGLDEPIREVLKYFWFIFEPLLFVLIGTEVKISDLRGNAIGFAILSLFIGLIIRFLISTVIVFGAKLNIKEKLFIGLSWIPKATVQAAIGPIALDMARQRNDPELEELAKFVLTIAVLSIIITAPLGAIAISMTANKFLSKNNTLDNDCVKNQTIFETNEESEERPLLNENGHAQLP